MIKLYVCDYIDPAVNQMDHLVVEAESVTEAEQKAIEQLKTLNIPKRYLLNVEEAI